MSTIKAVDKLRKLPRHGTNGFGAVVTANEETIDAIADEIEAEIEERYMELPVDADGVPVCVGDELDYTDPFGNVFRCTVQPLLAHDSKCYRHVKPRTLEDVLFDFGEEFEGEMDEIAPVIAKYAEEIRELLGVDDD